MATASPHPLKAHPRTRFRQRMFRVDAHDTLPITLRHERIYILPTQRGLSFICVVMVMLLASMNYGLNLGYALSFIMVGLFASCLLSTYLNLTQLRIQNIFTTDTFAKDPLEFAVTLAEDRNRSRHSIRVAAEGSSDQIDIRSNTSASATLRILDSRRGLFKLGRITISSDFPLGLWRGWGYVHVPVETYVYPAAESPTPELPIQNATAGDKKNIQQDEKEFSQLKPYQPTDTLTSVAWKQVARGSGWYSKEFEPSQTSSSTAIRWRDTSNQSGVEQRLSRMSAWVMTAQAQNAPYSMEMPGTTTKMLSGAEHKQKCLRTLATFSLEKFSD